MFDVLLSPQEREIQLQARVFAKEAIDPQFLKDLDREVIAFPHGFHAKVAAAGLYGIRFPTEYGGRGLSWTAEVSALEEIGPLGTVLGCQYSMPSIVGEALVRFGSEEQKQRFLVPMLRGEMVAAEGLTEPRGGSDFFGATTAESNISRVVLSGGGAKVAGFEKAFHERTGLPVEIMNPFSRMVPSSKFEPELLEEMGPALGVGVGLAMRRVSS